MTGAAAKGEDVAAMDVAAADAAAAAPDGFDGRVEWRQAPVPASLPELAGEAPWLRPLLARRGIEDAAAAAAFLTPHLDQLHDPGLLAGMAAAVERLLRARRGGETVAVVGDYDVDGVSGTAILTAVLGACRITALAILPHRLVDGYGFQPVHVERARETGCSLVVTVDCGTASLAAAEAAREAGLDVIVTDHHLPGEALPAGVILVNPRQEGCAYPYRELSGAGLALKLALALAAACERAVDPRLLLRIACLGTIADLVPLTGENRVIAALGLAELGRTRSAGLRALIRCAGLKPPFKAEDVGYRLGPRLNAPGRLDAADHALELLLSRDPRRAAALADDLDRWNRERQDEERRVAAEAREAVLARRPSGGALPAILVAWDETWHQGVVGIAAGRLARELNRPTLLLAVRGDQATGSGRSAAGVHLHGFLARWRADLPRFGGHAQAVGLTVPADRLETLREAWETAAEEWADAVAVRRLEYELDLRAGEVGDGLLADLHRLEPFGQGNPRPLVRVRGPLRLVRPPRTFGRGHLSAEAADAEGGRIRLLGWGWQPRAGGLMHPFEALGHLEEDRYRGGPVLRLVDCRPAAGA